MAKRVSQKIKSVQGRSTAATKSAASRSSGGFLSTYFSKRFFNKVVSAPATPYIAGGIGLAVIARFAYKYYQSHPEMMDTIKENLETVEGKLKDYTSNLVGSSEDLADDARH